MAQLYCDRPEFFRRYFGQRKVASMISASQDGGWLAAILEKLGIQPIRGSQHARGGQALLEAMKTQAAGYDLAITPDGSRGPVYRVKPGAAAVAIHCQAPILMLSFRFFLAPFVCVPGIAYSFLCLLVLWRSKSRVWSQSELLKWQTHKP